jgi:hypothetical protein
MAPSRWQRNANEYFCFAVGPVPSELHVREKRRGRNQ